jgi:hypothetical protein
LIASSIKRLGSQHLSVVLAMGVNGEPMQALPVL